MRKAVWLARHRKFFEISSWIICLILFLVGLRTGIFTDASKMERLLTACGIWAPLVFVVIQAIQVVVPILPGAVGCVFGVVFFGPLFGFIYNYIGICIGSIMAFLLARHYGIIFVKGITGTRFYDKYEKFLEKENQFEKLFAFLIFFPVAPDDFLCYLAGVSKMSLKNFTGIILLGKPVAIFLYSMGLTKIFRFAMGFAL